MCGARLGDANLLEANLQHAGLLDADLQRCKYGPI